MDLRGQAESDWSPSGDYRLTRFEGVLALVAKLIGPSPYVVGASLGGLVGLMAETFTDQAAFASLTLVDITRRMEPTGVTRVVGFMADRAEEGSRASTRRQTLARSISPWVASPLGIGAR
ncbi:MAG: hypothetical protein IPO30_20140 [Hyphomonadaceae bacterium]|nr:hypothetical protein [Hyphomonadaceae bacterium]